MITKHTPSRVWVEKAKDMFLSALYCGVGCLEGDGCEYCYVHNVHGWLKVCNAENHVWVARNDVHEKAQGS